MTNINKKTLKANKILLNAIHVDAGPTPVFTLRITLKAYFTKEVNIVNRTTCLNERPIRENKSRLYTHT